MPLTLTDVLTAGQHYPAACEHVTMYSLKIHYVGVRLLAVVIVRVVVL